MIKSFKPCFLRNVRIKIWISRIHSKTQHFYDIRNITDNIYIKKGIDYYKIIFKIRLLSHSKYYRINATKANSI